MAAPRKLDETSHVPLRTQLEDLLREEVAAGTYRVGERVPTVRELAEAYGVGKTTAASAIDTLVREGLLAARRQHGTKVAPRRAKGTRAAVKTGQIGVITTYATDEGANPYYASILASIQRTASDAGRAVLLFSGRSPGLKKAIAGGRVDGITYILEGRPDRRLLNGIRRAGLPVVTVDYHDPALDADAVMIDNRAGALAAMRHLVKLGHRRIAYIGPSTKRSPSQSTVERYGAYVEALAEAGVRSSRSLVARGSPAIADGEAAMRKLLPARPTAVFAFSDLLAFGAVRAAEESGLSVPARFSAVGFGKESAPWGLPRPLTTVEVDTAAMGRAAVEFLIERIDGRDGPPRLFAAATRLAKGRTTARAARRA